MARRLIGLDVGTNAVTVAEVVASMPPRLNTFGQVAMPRDAMREGEVVDEAAVSEAIARLRSEVGLGKASVRVGIASPRVIVRQVEMPVMSKDDLGSALRFQAPDLIPIPIDEAAIDYAVLGTDTPESGEPTMRVLLAAAQMSTVQRLVAAVERAGFGVEAVDLVPVALMRALGRTTSTEAPAAEGIVSFGGGVTSIVVHQDGVPRFVRVLGTGGRELTDAISAAVELPHETAESLKRQLGTPADPMVTRARSAVDRPLAALVEEVRGSIDYYRTQSDAVPLTRVVITGGGAQLPGIAERLAQNVGVPVELARPRDLLAVGNIGFAPEALPRLDPYLPAAVGLALGGTGNGTVINLVGKHRRAAAPGAARSRRLVSAAAMTAALLGVLAVPTLARQQAVSDAKHDVSTAEAQNRGLQTQINSLAKAREAQETFQRTKTQVESVLATDVSWAHMLDTLAKTMPSNTWLTGFDGAITPPAARTVNPTAPSPAQNTSAAVPAATTGTAGTTSKASTASAPIGTVTFMASGDDYRSVSAWLDMLAKNPAFARVFVPNAALAGGEESGSSGVVSFSSTASITGSARSTGRVEHYEGRAR
jgi:type IV pilus assembly protein PilM